MGRGPEMSCVQVPLFDIKCATCRGARERWLLPLLEVLLVALVPTGAQPGLEKGQAAADSGSVLLLKLIFQLDFTRAM